MGVFGDALELELVALEEPPYSEECWAGLQNYIEGGPSPTAGCAYAPAEVVIAVRSELIEGAPDVIDVFENWGFDIPEYTTVYLWRLENPNADIADSALWWLNTNRDVWSTWVTPEAATAVNAALDNNVIPEGWPTE